MFLVKPPRNLPQLGVVVALIGWMVGGALGWDKKKAGKEDNEGPARAKESMEISSSPAADSTALQREQAARTAAQIKLDSHIVLALKKSRREPPFDKPTSLDPDLAIEAGGRVLVDPDATVSKELLARIESDGGKVINSFEASRAIRALVPLMLMEALASRADIKFIAPAAQATTNRGGAAQAQGSSIKP